MPHLPLPARPRLADHVLPRRHQTRNEDIWVLYDEQSGLAYQIGAREWGLLAQADGTRDLEGIVAAAARSGTHAAVSVLQTFLLSLHQAQLLADGVGLLADPVDPPPPRPLEPLPDFQLACDGQGSCCRLYATVMFRPLEEVVARSLLPQVFDAGERPEQAFGPLMGSAPCGASSVGFVHGRCAYLGSEGRCGLHAAGGPQGKPLGCRMFPALFVDDGHVVRISPAVECACVLASLGQTHGAEPLVSPEVTTSDKLDPGIHISRLPDMILITKKRYAARDELIAWSNVVMNVSPSLDIPGVFLALAEQVQQWGLDASAAIQALTNPRRITPETLLPGLVALAERTQKRLHIDGSWRSDQDLALSSLRAIAKAATLLTSDLAQLEHYAAPTTDPQTQASEAFYLRAGAFGHQFVLHDAPLSLALHDRAVRLVFARAFGDVFSPDERDRDPVFRHPLALLEATLRGHGLLRDGLLR
jgi:lysine-N-methylase